jgi:hypothetical protein
MARCPPLRSRPQWRGTRHPWTLQPRTSGWSGGRASPCATWFHIDLTTGAVLERMDASRRWYRILFNALHSLDFPVLLAYRPAWDLVIISLCGLGLVLSVTAVVLAWRRLRTVWRRSG